MKFEITPTFSSDWKRLSKPHKRLFRAAIPSFSGACDEFARDPARYRWPEALRVSRMKSATGIWEMTWSYAGPDGRATFEFRTVEGEPTGRWRRIGSHSIYKDP